jgi:hypothetical protein
MDKFNDLIYILTQAMGISAGFCIIGWLAIYFSKVCVICPFWLLLEETKRFHLAEIACSYGFLLWL